MNKQLAFFLIVGPIWFTMHLFLQGKQTGLEPYDTSLMILVFLCGILGIVNKLSHPVRG